QANLLNAQFLTNTNFDIKKKNLAVSTKDDGTLLYTFNFTELQHGNLNTCV
ncbi:776_t:CDS:2, partial [Gigaspora rosea]